MKKQTIDTLPADARWWRGDSRLAGRRPALASGYSALDQALHDGGWPRAASTELLLDNSGIGELFLLQPALAALSQSRQLAWLNPPRIPYAPALATAGINPQNCLVLDSRRQREQLWAAEQLLRSGAFAAVLTWFQHADLADRDLRRLQLAAREGDCWHIHFRPLLAAQQASPAPLRMRLHAEDDRLGVEVLKQAGGRSGQQLLLARDTALGFQQQAAAQWPVWRQLPVYVRRAPALVLVPAESRLELR